MGDLRVPHLLLRGIGWLELVVGDLKAEMPEDRSQNPEARRCLYALGEKKSSRPARVAWAAIEA